LLCAGEAEGPLQRDGPSVDRSELLLAFLLIGYLYGITSERKLWKSCACIWPGMFTGWGFDQEIPHHSTFSKNRHGRFQESSCLKELFEQIVRQCWRWDWWAALSAKTALADAISAAVSSRVHTRGLRPPVPPPNTAGTICSNSSSNSFDS